MDSMAGRLARLGFNDATRAATFLLVPLLAEVCERPDVIDTFALGADPDLALISFSRIVDAADNAGMSGPLLREFIDDDEFRARLVRLLGSSEAMGEQMVRHPEHWPVLAEAEYSSPRPSGVELSDEFVSAVTRVIESGGTWRDGADALRVAYRRRLLALAVHDLSGDVTYEEVTGMLADGADAILEAALALAHWELPTPHAPCRLAIISMGKTGGSELNYISDVDVIFVAEPKALSDGTMPDEQAALQTATLLARGIMRVCNEATPEGTIWEVDPALRPEGKAGALVRTLASHVGYYERWAETWEFQALLKARYSAGDPELGRAYIDAVVPFVWAAADRPNFVADVQQMRRRVVDQLPARSADRELKLGPGGLRDVEFSVQLLQLVHGRSDVMLRSPNTLAALEAMSVWGYVGREDAATLATAYRFLRTIEHRLQLFRMQRTHVLPEDEASLRRLGRSIGLRKDPAKELLAELAKHRLAVRRLHEKLFYRPLLNAVARLDAGEARLTREAARERLQALGYVDPDGALRHLEALTSGVSRRAAIQRTLLPVLLGWFADAPNPDAGLLAFRQVSDALGGTPWYLRMLRDESETAERMAHLVASSRYATDLLLRTPEAVALLSDRADLVPRTTGEVLREMNASASRQSTPDAAIEAVRAVRRRELFRVAAADVCGELDVLTVGYALSDLTEATLEAALSIAISVVEGWRGASLPTDFTVIGLGRVGGCEAGYGSDADVMFVHDPHPGVDENDATKAALAVASELRRLLGLPSAGPSLEIDSDLRPEGKAGPYVRSLGSYARYYARWSAPWESQALLRARPIAGSAELGQKFLDLIDGLRWPEMGISDTDLREVRRLKARMESERLPRGADPALHIKLGRGGLSDVEWTAQLLQMRHAGARNLLFDASPGTLTLRSTNTLTVLGASSALGLISEEDFRDLADAWRMAARVRNAVILVTGRPSDQVPTDMSALAGIAFVLGYPHDQAARLTEDYLRVTRHARGVIERLFYGWTEEPEPDGA